MPLLASRGLSWPRSSAGPAVVDPGGCAPDPASTQLHSEPQSHCPEWECAGRPLLWRSPSSRIQGWVSTPKARVAHETSSAFSRECAAPPEPVLGHEEPHGVSMHVHACVCVRTCVCHMYMCLCVLAFMCACTYTHACTCTCALHTAYVCTCICALHTVIVRARRCTHMHMHMFIGAQCVHASVYMYACTHVCACMHVACTCVGGHVGGHVCIFFP